MAKKAKYGPRVIGEAAFKTQIHERKTKSYKYGPRVVGRQQPAPPPETPETVENETAPPAANAGEAETSTAPAVNPIYAEFLDANVGTVVGRLEQVRSLEVLAAIEELEARTKARKTVVAAIEDRRTYLQEQAATSTDGVKKTLEENPAALDELIDAELNRELPRRAVLLLLLEAELNQEDEPRSEVLKRLEAALQPPASEETS